MSNKDNLKSDVNPEFEDLEKLKNCYLDEIIQRCHHIKTFSYSRNSLRREGEKMLRTLIRINEILSFVSTFLSEMNKCLSDITNEGSMKNE